MHDDSMKGATFYIYVEQVFAPALKPGDIVIMDNLTVFNLLALLQRLGWRSVDVLYA